MAKRVKDKNAPKRPLTGFLLFGNYLRNNESTIKALPVTQQASAIAKCWKELNEEEKAVYNQQSEVLKEAYKRDVEAYVQTQAYQDFQAAQGGAGVSKSKPRKRQGTTKISGYRLFVKDNKDIINEGLNEEDVAKRHIAKCGIKWKMLSEEEKKVYTDRAALLSPENTEENKVVSDEAEE
ncbi:high mobility group protein B3-like [Arctopsyche grandis]|uniref:high mobility group protein B3-like n=1 Tax=Arctopsyche grandis TaxID=121162 RepID=UPI00406D814B